MFKYEELKDLHLEITSRCQASCPMCLRNHHGGQPNKLLQLHDWSLKDFKNRISVDLLNQLTGFYFCGNLGDPIINDNLISMIKYAVDINPDLYVRVHTNGGARSDLWWKDLANVLPQNHLVIFSLDGLSDTHSIYRIGTNFNNVLSNAKNFISNGGKAEWSFIKFKHNQHQTDEARSLARKIGFKSFTVKNTSRFIKDFKFPVLDRNSNLIYFLEPPSDMRDPLVTQSMIENYKNIAASAEILCPVQKEKQIFIDCRGIMFPCCWIGTLPWIELRVDSPAYEVKVYMLAQYNSLIEKFGGEDFLNTSKNSIRDIIESREWKNLENNLWHDDRFVMCARTCGKTKQSFIKAFDQKISVDNF